MLTETRYITLSFQPTKTLAWEEFKLHDLYYAEAKYVIVFDMEHWNIYELI